MRGLSALFLQMLLNQVWSAPRSTQESRPQKSEDAVMSNPFSLGTEQLVLLQGYLNIINPSQEPRDLPRYKAILHLFLIHDYDKSGHLDGLELIQLLRGILAQNLQSKASVEQVIPLVDEVLEKQDLDRDGLLSAHEMVTASVYESSILLVKEQSHDNLHVVVPPPDGVHIKLNSGIVETNDKTKEEPVAGGHGLPDAEALESGVANDSPGNDTEELHEISRKVPGQETDDMSDETDHQNDAGTNEQEEEEEDIDVADVILDQM
ncbi:cell growth regulator with EF hand domain protein 1 [Bombina bombina]|uniref:cell growth regulator with EF hand domain protein 1 n=1 Tax=Bombina bombina TaxID=8345 RepID=UPI00235A9D6E|nr:cell growth regulator with EF hand domain protein 1 [Bombina bombina]